jgi:hypothetical protein
MKDECLVVRFVVDKTQLPRQNYRPKASQLQ